MAHNRCGIKITLTALDAVVDHPDVILQVVAHMAVPFRVAARIAVDIIAGWNFNAVVLQKVCKIDAGQIHGRLIRIVPLTQNDLLKVLGRQAAVVDHELLAYIRFIRLDALLLKGVDDLAGQFVNIGKRIVHQVRPQMAAKWKHGDWPFLFGNILFRSISTQRLGQHAIGRCCQPRTCLRAVQAVHPAGVHYAVLDFLFKAFPDS